MCFDWPLLHGLPSDWLERNNTRSDWLERIVIGFFDWLPVIHSLIMSRSLCKYSRDVRPSPPPVLGFVPSREPNGRHSRMFVLLQSSLYPAHTLYDLRQQI